MQFQLYKNFHYYYYYYFSGISFCFGHYIREIFDILLTENQDVRIRKQRTINWTTRPLRSHDKRVPVSTEPLF